MNSLYQKIIGLIFLMGSTIVYPQNFLPPESLDVSKGLPSDYIINSVVSPTGYLYLATKRGISKYDGYRFVNVNSTKAIWSELYHKNGFIYYHDTEGLFKWNCGDDSRTIVLNNDFSDQNPNNDHFNNIFVDSENRIWGTDFNYVKYFSPEQKSLKTFLIDAENKSLDHYSIIEIVENEVWISSKNGLWIWTFARRNFDQLNGTYTYNPNAFDPGYDPSINFNLAGLTLSDGLPLNATGGTVTIKKNNGNNFIVTYYLTTPNGPVEGQYSGESISR